MLPVNPGYLLEMSLIAVKDAIEAAVLEHLSQHHGIPLIRAAREADQTARIAYDAAWLKTAELRQALDEYAAKDGKPR